MITKCQYCQIEFYVMPYQLRNGEGKHCSRKCQHDHRITRLEYFFKNISHEAHPEDCWIWTGRRIKFEYGTMVIKRKNCTAHRVSWTFHYGEIPKGMCILHHCDNPPCVNPDHLFVGTYLDNAKDRTKKQRGHMPSGSKNPMSKLNEEQVIEIRRRLANGEKTKILAKDFNMERKTIDNIKTRRSWKHI